MQLRSDETLAVVLKANIRVRGKGTEPGDEVVIYQREVPELEYADIVIRKEIYEATPENKTAYDAYIARERADADLPPLGGKGKKANVK